jgi:hypothetical protein
MEYTNQDKERFNFFCDKLDMITSSCKDNREILILASCMMEYARKGLCIGCNSSELGNSLMFDFINSHLYDEGCMTELKHNV